MSETVITVQGSAVSELPPEQAMLRFTITADGPERAPVLVSVSTALDAVAEIVDHLAAHELVAIDGLEWTLTDARLEIERHRALARAVAAARAKAEALADPGMLDGSGGGVAPMPRLERAMAMSAQHDGTGFSLRPEPIIIELAVDARFSAR